MSRASALGRRPLHIAPRSDTVRPARAVRHASESRWERAALATIALAVAPLSCGASEGPLLVRSQRDGGLAEEDASRSPVRAGMSLQYQITGALDLEVDAALYVTDLFDTEPAEVVQLQGRERVVMAYVS